MLLGRSDDGLWYVVDVQRTRSSPLEVERLVRATAEQDSASAAAERRDRPSIRMEQEPGSAGVAVIDQYRRRVLPEFDFAGARSTGSKETRAAPVAARAEAGDLWICRGPFNTAFLDELISFPFGPHDDQVDALAGAYVALGAAGPTIYPVPVSITRPSPWRMEPVWSW